MDKDVTLLIAHPDDEALWCWPVLDRVKKIVCVSDDSNNPERVWCKDRGVCLQEVGALLGAQVVCEHYSSEFYRLPTRDGSLKRLAEVMIKHLADAETIFSHNAHGEYGHLDHILCHHIARIAQSRTGCDLLWSDIAQEVNWLPVKAWQDGILLDLDCHIDMPLFERIKAIYDSRGCWTWSHPPVTRCAVYYL